MANNADHDSKGRFTKGNTAARGNPYTRKAGEFRKALFASVTAKDIREVIAQLKEQAKAGDLKAIALFLDRTLGTAQNCGLDLLERLEQAEQTIEETALLDGGEDGD